MRGRGFPAQDNLVAALIVAVVAYHLCQALVRDRAAVIERAIEVERPEPQGHDESLAWRP